MFDIYRVYMLEKVSRYIDPLNDFGFKHLFGRVQNKDIMIGFLNALFEGQKHIKDIVYSPTEYGGESTTYRKVYFDSMCTSDDQSQFIIEMQRRSQKDFRDRCIYYQSKLINEQSIKGGIEGSATLNSVYLIGILDFKFEDSPEGKCYHDIGLKNHDNGNIFYNKLGYKFLELPNFTKQEEELVTDLDKWFFLLKNMHRLGKIPDCMDKPVFQKIFKIAELSNLTKEERMFFDSNTKAQWDYEKSIEYAAELAKLEGEKKGEKEGRKAEKILTATKLKAMGLPFAEISKVTSLSIPLIMNLK